MEHEAKKPVYLSISVFLDLEFHLMEARPGVNPDAFVEDLVKRWLAIEMERLSLRKNGRPMHGFQWKNVFLPDGTTLRTRHRNTVEFAKVVGDHIVSDEGAPLTPSQFVNRHAQGRNAWRFIWLRFPGNDYWIRADKRRMHTDELMQRQSKNDMT